MSVFRRGAPGALAFLCLSGFPPAFAQEGATPLPEVAVAGAAGSLTVPTVDEQRRAVEATVGSVAFVDGRRFENRYTNNLTDVLRDVPGVYAQTRYGQEIRLSIRGSGVARGFHTRGIEILQDGIPFNFADGSGDFYQLDPIAFRSIEVFKGGNALVFGASTLGGAVNAVSPTAFTALSPAFVRLEGGSFGAVRASVQASAIQGDADALLTVTRSHQDGYRAHQNQDYVQANGNFGYRVAPDIETRFYLGLYDTRQKLPGTLSLSDTLNFPTRANLAAVTGNQARDVSAQRIANRTSFALDVGTLSVDTWFIHKNLYHPIFQVVDQDGLTYGIAPHWTGSFEVGGLRDDLTLGLRYVGGTNSALQFVNVAGFRGAATARARQTANNFEAFADNRLWITPDLALMTGAKLFRQERDFDNFFVAPVRRANRDYDGFNPKIGLLYQPAPTIQVFADLARSRDVPDFSDLAQSNLAGLTFVPLAAQKAWTVEVGTRGQADRFRWDVTLYRSAIRDELINFSTNAALGIPAATFNADRTRHQGLELGGAFDLVRDVSGPGAGDTLTIAQNWTLNDFRFVRDRVFGGNQIAAIPRHVLRTTLTYGRPDGFFLAPSVDWVPQGAFADHANTLRVPGYALFGVSAGATLAPGITAFVDARNLTDVRYVSDFAAVADARQTPATFYPGEGRSVFAGLKVAF